MTETEHYRLNLWEPSDRIKRTAFNANSTAIDAALATKAEKSAVTAVETALANYKTSNDAAVASAAAKANAAYSADNSPFEFVTVSTEGMVADDTVYTFEKEPKFVILQGKYSNAVLMNGASVILVDKLVPNVSSDTVFKLSKTSLILVSRWDEETAVSLTILVHY